MTLRTTSRVFDAPRVAYQRLLEQTWPAHPVTGVAPVPTMVEPNWAEQLETIWVVPDTGDDGSIEWESFPHVRSETFDVTFRLRTLGDARDELAVWNRLEVLADVVQRAFFNDGDLGPGETEVDRLYVLGNAGQKLEGFQQVSGVLVPAGSEGIAGIGVVVYRAAFRI